MEVSAAVVSKTVDVVLSAVSRSGAVGKFAISGNADVGEILIDL